MARGSLLKDGDGWRGQLYLGKRHDGREVRRSKKFPAKKGFDHTRDGKRRAEAAMAEWVDSVKDWNIVADTMTFNELIDRFIAAKVDVPGANPNTVGMYRWSQNHVREYHDGLGEIPITKLQVRDMEGLIFHLHNRGMAKSSLNQIRHHMRAALKYAMRDEWVTRNVADLVDLPKTATSTKRRSMTIEQAQAFLRAAEGHRLEAAWFVGMTRALRPGELLGLRWSDLTLDGDRPVLRVRKARKSIDGKLVLGDLKKNYQTDETKAHRDLDLNPMLVAKLRAHREQWEKARKRAGTNWDETWDNVFATRNGTLIAARNFQRDATNLQAKAGIDVGKPYSPYEILRHTGLSILSAIGLPDAALIDLAGHHDEQMLHRHYRHQIRDSVDAGVDAITSLLK